MLITTEIFYSCNQNSSLWLIAEAESERSRRLIYFPNAHTGQGWAGPEAEGCDAVPVAHGGSRENSVPWAITAASQGLHSGKVQTGSGTRN